jgi:hypothetical protein
MTDTIVGREIRQFVCPLQDSDDEYNDVGVSRCFAAERKYS